MKISLLAPTRGRSDQIERFWYSALDLAKLPDDLEASFYIDEDDIDSIYAVDGLRGNVRYKIGSRMPTLSHAWNEAWKNSTGEIYMMAADDLIFRSLGWDVVIREEFEKQEDRILLVYGSDGYVKHDGGLATHPFIHRNWTDVIGYFAPPYFWHSKNDSWLTIIAKKLERLNFIPYLLFEHMHPGFRKGLWDRTYEEAKKFGVASDFKKIWKDTTEERIENIVKLKDFINNYDKKS